MRFESYMNLWVWRSECRGLFDIMTNKIIGSFLRSVSHPVNHEFLSRFTVPALILSYSADLICTWKVVGCCYEMCAIIVFQCLSSHTVITVVHSVHSCVRLLMALPPELYIAFSATIKALHQRRTF